MIGEFLLIWLVVGLIVGIKCVYVDGFTSEEEIKKSIAEMRAKGKEPNPKAAELARNNKVVIAVMTLAGFYSLYSYIKSAIDRKRKSK